MSDPAKYRSKDELQAYKEKDPIQQLFKHMVKEKMTTKKAYETLEEEIKEIVESAVTFSEESNEPPISSLYEDVFSD